VVGPKQIRWSAVTISMLRLTVFPLIAMLLAVTACGGPVDPAPDRTTKLSASPSGGAIASAGAPPSGMRSAPSPASVTPLPTLLATPSPATTVTKAPSAKPVSMTEQESGLVLVLREDARVNCEPRRSDLPIGATAGIECLIGSAIVERVGVYGFDYDPRAAAHAYLERMEREDVLGAGGDCRSGSPGDSPYEGSDGIPDEDSSQVTYKGALYAAARAGCFRNEDGVANFRATCDSDYIGVLGRTSALDDLTEWAMRVPDDEPYGAAPGLCFGSFGGGIDCPDMEEGDVC
jgi:hypothetical protein